MTGEGSLVAGDEAMRRCAAALGARGVPVRNLAFEMTNRERRYRGSQWIPLMGKELVGGEEFHGGRTWGRKGSVWGNLKISSGPKLIEAVLLEGD